MVQTGGGRSRGGTSNTTTGALPDRIYDGGPSRGWYAERVPSVLVFLGVALFAAVIAELVLFHRLGQGRFISIASFATLLLDGVPALLVAYAGYRLERSGLERERYVRLGAWCVGAFVVFLGINLLLIAVVPASTLKANVGWAVGTGVFGAFGGLVIGTIEARAVQRAVVAERATVRTEQIESQRQWLDYLNGLLRHEVLNNANVIVGYADLLEEEYDLDDEVCSHIETIQRQSRNMTDVITDVRILIAANDGEDDFEVVSLVDVLEETLADLRATSRGVDVETSFPGDVQVVADDLLPRVFSNLLVNAVEHNDSVTPRIGVEVETTDESALVRVSDNGPGIPESERATLFDRDTHRDHGLGLFLVKTLAERYGGSVELTETGGGGTTFTVELPRVQEVRASSFELAGVESDGTSAATESC
ncbi:MAG: ATP-binding protein [Salinigranum sp.]